MPQRRAFAIQFDIGDEIDRITLIEPLTGHTIRKVDSYTFYPAKQFVTPMDKLAGLEAAIFAERDRKLEAAREVRRRARHAAREVA